MNGRPYTREDDALLRELVGQYPAWKIAVMMARTVHSVRGRMKRLGLVNKLPSNLHWNAKADVNLVRMIQCATDAGMRPVEIASGLQHAAGLSRHAIEDIAAGRTWR